MKATSKSTVFAVLPTMMIAAIPGCGAAPATEADPTVEPAGETSDAVIGSVMGSWTDWSGQVTFRLYMCPASESVTPQEFKTESCSVDSDFAVTGGGAEICHTNPGGSPCPTDQLQWNPGALLASSSPESASTWRVASRTWQVPTGYWLRAYAIGMKLTGVANTRNVVFYQFASGKPGFVNSCNVSPAPGTVLVGGGVEITGPDFLQASHQRASGDTIWDTFKSNFAPLNSQIWCRAITVQQCPAGFSGCLKQGLFTWNGPTVSTGYTSTSFEVPFGSGWAMSSIGGETLVGLNGRRFLTDMLPQLGQGKGAVTIWSKDHVTVTSGNNIATAVVVAKQ